MKQFSIRPIELALLLSDETFVSATGKDAVVNQANDILETLDKGKMAETPKKTVQNIPIQEECGSSSTFERTP